MINSYNIGDEVFVANATEWCPLNCLKKPCTIVGVQFDKQSNCMKYLVEQDGNRSLAWFKESYLFGNQWQGIHSICNSLYNECIERAAAWIDTAWELRNSQEKADEDVLFDLIETIKEYIEVGNERTVSSELYEKVATMVAQHNPKQHKG
jgi:hypothetical protein